MSVEENLTAVLRERADRAVDVDALLTGALAGGRARKRRQQRAMALAGAGVAGVTAATVLTVPLGGGGGGLTADRLGITGEPMPALPAAEGEPGLAQRPDLVGTDPNVLRFAVPWAPMPVVGVSWSSVDRVEQVGLNMISPQSDDRRTIWLSTTVTATRGSLGAPEGDRPETRNRTTAVTVGGRPGAIEHEPVEAGTSWLTWQAADGVEMRVGPGASAIGESGPVAGSETVPDGLLRLSDADLVRLAESIRLDGTTRCTAPIRLTTLPDDAHLVGCTSSMLFGRPDGGTSYDTGLDFADPAGAKLNVWVNSPADPSPGPSSGSDPSGSYAPDLGSEPTATYYPSAPGTDPSATYVLDPSGSDPPVSYTPDPSGMPSDQPFVPDESVDFARPGLVGTVSTTGGYDRADIQPIIDGVEVAGEVADPTTWPARPAG